MSDRLVPLLGWTASSLTALYMGLVVMTILFATWQTDTVARIGDTEAAIGTLESSYYQEMNAINTTDPSSLGFVTPKDVSYVATAATGPTLTRAGN